MAFSSDLSQVQERLAVLEKKAEIELENVHKEGSINSPPDLPPKDYLPTKEDVV